MITQCNHTTAKICKACEDENIGINNTITNIAIDGHDKQWKVPEYLTLMCEQFWQSIETIKYKKNTRHALF